ncbi:MAG TPA: MopE-related protein [Myxococcota bacterium]|nr:MopE-related protein [Myxococcota bacterium]HRY92879.1 MopE-related protein [Myxococcota bacterium]HSA22565.1 MopE-related protein [Myxococcota bacterium]
MLRKYLRTVGLLCLPAMLALTACNLETDRDFANKHQSIINGTATSEWPAVGALAIDDPSYQWMTFCSATLIASQWVLTAAHCADPDSVAPATMVSFFVGANATNPANGNVYQIDAVYLHPQWDPDTTSNDIALYHLSSAVPAAVATPIPYNTAAISNGQSITMVGYGVNTCSYPGGSDNCSGDGIKRKGVTTINQTWSDVYYFLANNSNQLVCYGDSGGPDLATLSGQLRVVGVHSTVDSGMCDNGSYSTRVDGFQSFIDDTLNGGGPTSCAMIGGDCDTQACWFTADAGVYSCLPSLNKSNYTACDPEATSNLECRDGAGCFDFTEGAICYEFCYTAADCSGARACANVFTDVAELGLCVTSCNILGGTCGAGKACYPVDVDANTCIDSDELGLDASCDPNPASGANLPCDDGMICIQTTAAEHVGRCMDFCLADNTCGAGNHCQKPLFQGIDDLGVCVCIDADNDNYCQEIDCDDQNAAVNPAHVEVCDNGLDDDCDGETDEGCCPDADGDGHLAAACGGDDCNDQNASTYPGAGENCNDSADNDCDGQVNEGCGACTDADADGYCSTNDCNDQNAAQNPGEVESCADQLDNDCDGTVNENCGTCTDLDDDGYCEAQDCNDLDYWTNPGRAEFCGDDKDNNCDGQAEEGCGTCADADQDGFEAAACGGTDCNDANAAQNPGVAENCADQIDNNCSGQINEGCGCTDNDGDGYCLDVDCLDSNAQVNPGAAEACGDALDNDCDGQVNEGCGACTDIDQDGYCNDVDCNDFSAAVHPGAAEACGDAIDNDCDGALDEGCGTCTDRDADGFEDAACGGTDCNDLDFFTKPGAAEICGDSADNDCDGTVDEGCGACTDADQDGACAGEDCDDHNAAVRPGAGENCNDQLDNDCDGTVNDGCGACTDADLDGYCQAEDCDDLDAAVNPGALDACGDLVDNDCDGSVDETCDQPCAVASQCDDLNPCTVDACGLDLQCEHSLAPDFTACGPAGRGVCASGQCVLPPDNGGSGCQSSGGGEPGAGGFGLLGLALCLGLLRRFR